jgi:hypothetical protein
MMKPARLVVALFILLAISSTAFAQKKARAEVAGDVARLHAELDELVGRLKEKEAELLAAPAEDKKAFAEFLARPGTGLVRLLPRDEYDLFINGNGAYYSFSHRTHEYGRGSDIELQGQNFNVGFAGADFGLFVSLGDVPLEDVSLETTGVSPLAEFEAPTDTVKAREQYTKSMAGFETDGRPYRKEVPVKVNHAYILRSVNYGESDVLVAFRVVRQDDDGSVVLLWKMLKEFPKPDLLRMERDSAARQ